MSADQRAELLAAASDVMTPAEVGAACHVDPKTVTRWARSGKIPFTWTPGGHRRYSAADVYALIHGSQPGGSS